MGMPKQVRHDRTKGHCHAELVSASPSLHMDSEVNRYVEISRS